GTAKRIGSPERQHDSRVDAIVGAFVSKEGVIAQGMEGSGIGTVWRGGRRGVTLPLLTLEGHKRCRKRVLSDLSHQHPPEEIGHLAEGVHSNTNNKIKCPAHNRAFSTPNIIHYSVPPHRVKIWGIVLH